MTRPTYLFALSQHTATDPLDGKFASSRPPGSGETAEEEAISLRRFSGRYWFVELPGGEHKALSTEEVADTLKDGHTTRAISGPFATRDEAARSLERYWEMIMDNGNLAGILTETDLLKQIDGIGTDLYEFKLEQIMSYPVEIVPPDSSVLQASQIH